MRKRIVSLGLLATGVFLMVQIIMPIISFKVWEATTYHQNKALISPDSNMQILGVFIKNVSDFPAIFSENNRPTVASYNEFYLTVPSIKLDKVKVIVDTNDFEQNLAHLPGTALPGEKGNVFITGHSSFTQFYRPRNFKAIFAHLPEVKKGEEIIVQAGGQIFRYRVQGLKIVDPKETSVINPPDENGRYLTLMTCVPPGFYLKRLIVLASLI